MTILPPIKWVGGKRWLIERHARFLPARPAPGATYREPFAGGAAVFFGRYAAHRPAVLSDVNVRLLAVYEALRDDVEGLIAELGRHPYQREHLLSVRHRLNTRPDAPVVERAAWFIVINRHGFNGLYRENQKGECNVPFGDGVTAHLADVSELRACSHALQGVTIRRASFLYALADARPGDVCFLDPPYVPVSSTANFTGYNAAGFGPREQAALVSELHRLDALGVRWCLTNSEEARPLYEGRGWRTAMVSASRNLGCKAETRGETGEVIVTNYEVEREREEQIGWAF